MARIVCNSGFTHTFGQCLKWRAKGATYQKEDFGLFRIPHHQLPCPSGSMEGRIVKAGLFSLHHPPERSLARRAGRLDWISHFTAEAIRGIREKISFSLDGRNERRSYTSLRIDPFAAKTSSVRPSVTWARELRKRGKLVR